jgi:hypothetical protein
MDVRRSRRGLKEKNTPDRRMKNAALVADGCKAFIVFCSLSGIFLVWSLPKRGFVGTERLWMRIK